MRTTPGRRATLVSPPAAFISSPNPTHRKRPHHMSHFHRPIDVRERPLNPKCAPSIRTSIEGSPNCSQIPLNRFASQLPKCRSRLIKTQWHLKTTHMRSIRVPNTSQRALISGNGITGYSKRVKFINPPPQYPTKKSLHLPSSRSQLNG